MADAAEEAKQLDSVTDVVQEKELDAGKAQQAMTALGSSSSKTTKKQAASSVVPVSKEDVALIVSELEVTEEEATRALRQVVTEDGVVPDNGNAVVVAALRKLVVS